LVKYCGTSCAVHLHQTAKGGRSGRRTCIILVRHPRFSARRTSMQCSGREQPAALNRSRRK
jgi:hypothetical protein